jgi:trk system potassium uptake protein
LSADDIEGRSRWLTRFAGRPRPGQKRDEVLVIGLGRFGGALAVTLADLGHDVLGVDSDVTLVQQYATPLGRTVICDTTDIAALRQIGAAEFRQAVVGIGGDIQASILTALALVDLQIPNIWAKAVTADHARILQRVGVHHVVLPEHEMGKRVAHLVTNRMHDYIPLDEGFSLVEMQVPTSLVGLSVVDSRTMAHHGVTVVCIKPAGGVFQLAAGDHVFGPGDLLLVGGHPDAAEAFGALA